MTGRVPCGDRETRAAPVRSRAPVPVQEVTRLRVLLVCLFTLVLVTQATAATTKTESTPAPRPKAKVEQTALTLDQRLERKLDALRRYRSTVRFFENHRSLLAAGARHSTAKARLAYAENRVRQLSKTIAVLRERVRARDARRLAGLPPKEAICNVFGSYCREALAIAWCESRHEITAQNGQYLGLFQMGSYERQLFGHGATARSQAVAAHRYFVRSGRDWSPWACRWAAS